MCICATKLLTKCHQNWTRYATKEPEYILKSTLQVLEVSQGCQSFQSFNYAIFLSPNFAHLLWGFTWIMQCKKNHRSRLGSTKMVEVGCRECPSLDEIQQSLILIVEMSMK